MDSFDIDAFINQSFKNLEDKEKLKNKKPKNIPETSKTTIQTNKETNKFQENKNIINDKNKMIIDDLPQDKIDEYNNNKINMKIYNKSSFEETKNTKNIPIKDFIKPMFPNEEVFEKEFTSDKIYIIDKFIKAENKKNKKKQKKLNYTHGLVKQLKKEKFDYGNLLSMNKMWQEYITELMNNTNKEEIILNKILKADLHGAILTVIKSTNVNNIGIEGIVLFESKRTFNILNKKNEVKTVLKQGSVFEIYIDYNNSKIIIYGDNFIFKSAERTKIKFKPKYNFNADIFN